MKLVTLWLQILIFSFLTPSVLGAALGWKAGGAYVLAGIAVGIPIGVGTTWSLNAMANRFFPKIESVRSEGQQAVAGCLVYLGALIWIFVGSCLVYFLLQRLILPTSD